MAISSKTIMHNPIQEFKLGIKKNLNYVIWIDKEINKQITHTVAGSANSTRADTPSFWINHYNLRSGNTGQVSLFGKFGGNLANARYKDGRRVVVFNLLSRKYKKTAILYSWVMNMYENDAVIKNFFGTGKQFRRTGTKIFATKIAPYANKAVDKNIAKFEKWLTDMARSK